MKKYINGFIFFLLMVLNRKISYSQERPLCGYDSIIHQMRMQDPGFRKMIDDFEKLWLEKQKQKENSPLPQTTTTPYIVHVPVVFHILHNNGPENIPDSLIYQEVEIINECFRKKPGTPGDGNGGGYPD